jgi:hypothetical protein
MMGYAFGRTWGGAVEGALAVREVARAAYGVEDVAEAAVGPADPGEPEPGSPDPDEIEALGDRIATLAAHIHAAEGEMLPLIARYERLGGWERAGHKSCAHWLSFRTGYCLNAARERVRVARALDELPLTAATMARGELSFSQVRALTRVARPETEADLIELATGCTTAQLEIMVRAWRKHSRLEEAELERERYLSRRFAVFPDDEGSMYLANGRFVALQGATLRRGVAWAADILYHEERVAGLPEDEDTEAAAARRRADALCWLVERAMAAGPYEDDTGAGEDAGTNDAKGTGDRRAISDRIAERYQVMLHVDPVTLARDGTQLGRAELEDGTRVSAETCRRIACDAGIVRVEHDETGAILNVGRRSRSTPTAVRRALDVRDRGCRFPGCGLRFTQSHHVEQWTDGGETSLRNTVLLCRYHHRLVHEGGWDLQWWPHGRVAFIDPRGTIHVGGEKPRPPKLPTRPAEALVRRHRLNGVEPDAYTASARWKRERDIPDAVLFRATEAGLA